MAQVTQAQAVLGSRAQAGTEGRSRVAPPPEEMPAGVLAGLGIGQPRQLSLLPPPAHSSSSAHPGWPRR
ncbi:MAG: hypothetical protein ACYCZM_06895, partial [Acidimicrobiales bacterium]